MALIDFPFQRTPKEAASAPAWFPLSVDALSKRVVRDSKGNVFAEAAGSREAKWIVLIMNAAEKAQLLALTLEMGRVIRLLDENNEHLEFWTQDDEYILDGRFPAP